MKFREYCCCAIPTANAGIYVTLVEQFVLGILVGTLSLATPSIVGAATPSFAPWVLGIIAFGAGGIQLLGLLAVAKGKPILFRRFVSLHSIFLPLAFSVALAWIILSATRHETAKSECIKTFFDTTDSDQRAEADTMCEIFPWVDIGLMGGLWLLLAVLQTYLYVVMLSYNTFLQEGGKYDALNDSTANMDSIPMTSQGRWDGRVGKPDDDFIHKRQDSATSVADIMSQPMRKPDDGFKQAYQYGDPYSSYGHPSQPSYAYTQEPSPTPNVSDPYYTQPGRDNFISRPSQVQPHPAEGSFHRKPPRLVKEKYDNRDYY